jgi:hypothetical protein
MDDSSGCNPNSSFEEHKRANHPFPHYPAPSLSANIRPQFNQQLQHHFPIDFNPYGMPPYQPYGIPYEGNFNFSPGAMFGRGAASEAVQSSSPVESMAFPHPVAGSSLASPISIAPQNNEDDVSSQVWSDNSEDEKKGGRLNWSEEEDLKLVGSWLHNSVDPIKGNGQKFNDFWKKIVAEFNSLVPLDRRRSVS